MSDPKGSRSGFLRSFRTLGLRSEIYFFIENLSALLSSGMGVTAALSSVAEELSSRRLRNIVGDVEEAVAEGKPLSRALDDARVLTPHMLSLIRLGEQSGRLSENLRVVVLQNEKDMLFRSKVRSSLSYVSIVFVLATVVGVGTAWFTLPKLAEFFQEVEAELPLITRILIALGEFLRDYGVIFVPFFFAAVAVIFYFLFSFPKTKFIGHSLLFRTPVIKRLIKHAELARFGFLLGTMLDAEMPALQALYSMPQTTTFLNYRRFYEYLGEKVREGYSFQKCFATYNDSRKLFPASVRQMIAAAEQAGTLSETLIRIGKMHERKVEAIARDLPVLLEPALLIIIGTIVALLALGTILPIYSLTGVL